MCEYPTSTRHTNPRQIWPKKVKEYFKRKYRNFSKNLSGHHSEKSISEVIDQDEEANKVKQIIREGIVQNNDHIRKFVEVWDAYKEIWQINKNAFIKRYQKHNPAVSSFDADIARYSEVQNNIQKEDTTITINFVLVDSNSIKLRIKIKIMN